MSRPAPTPTPARAVPHAARATDRPVRDRASHRITTIDMNRSNSSFAATSARAVSSVTSIAQACVAGAAVLAVTAAQAQSTAPAAASAAPATSTYTLGAGVAVTSRYSGSDETMAVPLIAADYQHSSGFFASTMRGLGYGGATNGISYSASVGYRGPRYDQKKQRGGFSTGSDFLRGMGEVKGSATGNLSVGYAVLPWLDLQVRTEQPLTQRENGATYSLGASAKLMNDATDTIGVSVGGTAGDSKYMQTYYGVSAAQAARTAFKAYTPKSGFKEIEAGVNWQHRFDSHWSVTGAVGAQTLVGDAAKSPLVRRKTTPVAAVYGSYTF